MAKPLKAVHAKELPDWNQQISALRDDAGRLDKLANKKFEDLSKDEKDLLLKALAVRFGFIQPSKDK